jgi:hypothetical protein
MNQKLNTLYPLEPLWTEGFKGIVGWRTLGIVVAERLLQMGY